MAKFRLDKAITIWGPIITVAKLDEDDTAVHKCLQKIASDIY